MITPYLLFVVCKSLCSNTLFMSGPCFLLSALSILSLSLSLQLINRSGLQHHSNEPHTEREKLGLLTSPSQQRRQSNDLPVLIIPLSGHDII